ncbi:IS1096 element passenger TnpR family protein [Tomitella biformata]|uniref:IS1096 element passenger TnpR family protein n=1 Tax=Tomitella biformata TaxID=630403 RepID=UPI00130E929B|nr:hypothetical protein [Tomitella biformata]
MATSRSRGRGHLSLVPPLADAVAPQASATTPVSGRQTPLQYTLRVECEGPGNPSWRRLLVPRGMVLDALHKALCATLDWDDRGPHAFVTADGTFAAESRRIESSPEPDATPAGEPDHVAARGIGVLHSDKLRLHEVLRRTGEAMSYENSGDGVVRRAAITVEDVEPIDQRPGQYPVLLAGEDEVEIAAGNARLRRLYGLPVFTPAEGSVFAALLSRLPEARAPQFYSMLPRIGQDLAPGDQPGGDQPRGDQPSAEPARDDPDRDRGPEHAVFHLHWLLRRIGPDGIDLDNLSRLPKPIVSAARKEVCSPDRWRPRSLKESDNREIVSLRAAAEDFGLTRVHEGPPEPGPLNDALAEIANKWGTRPFRAFRLERTDVGETLAEDQGALLRHVLTSLPFGETAAERDDALLWLAVLAAGIPLHLRTSLLAEAMAALGPDVEARTRTLQSGKNVNFLFAIDAADWWYDREEELNKKRWVREFARLVLAQPVQTRS